LATAGSNGRLEFQQEPLAIRQDSEVKSLARRRTGIPEAAEERPQTAYCAVCLMANPVAVENLHACFCRGLICDVYREPGQLGATAAEDFAHLIGMHQGRSEIGSSGHRPVPKAVTVRLFGQGWQDVFSEGHGELTANVPSRSHDPTRHQASIVDVAEHRLCIYGPGSDTAPVAQALRQLGRTRTRDLPRGSGLPGCRAAARCTTQVRGNLPARAVPSSGRGQRAPPFRSKEPDPVQETGPMGGSPTALIIRHAVRNFA
jgi:hypothetical protein